jgi:hypothetical protein
MGEGLFYITEFSGSRKNYVRSTSDYLFFRGKIKPPIKIEGFPLLTSI